LQHLAFGIVSLFGAVKSLCDWIILSSHRQNRHTPFPVKK
jgi:hypothetical protein